MIHCDKVPGPLGSVSLLMLQFDLLPLLTMTHQTHSNRRRCYPPLLLQPESIETVSVTLEFHRFEVKTIKSCALRVEGGV